MCRHWLAPLPVPVTKTTLKIWGEDSIATKHNCLSFGLAALGAGFLTPGSIAKQATSESSDLPVDENWLTNALTQDGLEQVQENSVCLRTRRVVIGYYLPKDPTDFHIRYLSPQGCFEKRGHLRPNRFNGDYKTYHCPWDGHYKLAGFFAVSAQGVKVYYPDVLPEHVICKPRLDYALDRIRATIN